MVILKNDNYNYIFKVCLIGAGGVGKTCIVRRLCYDSFSLNTQLTVGIDFYTHDLPFIVNGKETKIRLSIWDFGGQEHFKSLFKYYINGANGIFLVFDLLKMESLIKLDWFYEKLFENNIIDRPKILIGTKFDLAEGEDKSIKIDDLIIEQYLKTHKVKDFIKTSSLDNINIKYIFNEIVKKILEFHEFDYKELL